MTTYGGWTRGVKSAMRLVTGALLCLVMAVTLGLAGAVSAEAAISTVTGNAWSQIYSNGAGTRPGTVSYSVSPGLGSKRLLVVAVSTETASAAAETLSITYGGQVMTPVRADGSTTQAHSYLFYLKGEGLDTASNSDLVFTFGGASAALTAVYATVFDGVDQTTPVTGSSGNTGTTSVALSSAIVPLTGETTIEVVSMGRSSSGTARTITSTAANWTITATGTALTDGTRMLNPYILTDIAAGSTTAQHSISSTTSSTYSMSAMRIKPAPPENRTTPDSAAAIPYGSTTIRVSMPYADDDDADGSSTVEYKLATASSWTTRVANVAHTSSPYSVDITGLTAGAVYDVRVTYSDPDGFTDAEGLTVSQVIRNVETQPLTTRLYLHNATADISPAVQGSLWDVTTGVLDLSMGRVKVGTAATRGQAETSNSAVQVLLAKFISQPLSAQVITSSHALNWVIGTQENSSNANDFWAAHVYVVSSDGETVRGTLLNGYTESSSGWSTTATGKGPVSARTLSALTLEQGDRVVIEIGYNTTNTSTTSYTGTINYGGTGTTDLALGDTTTSVTSRPGWFQFSPGLVFADATAAGAVEATAATTSIEVAVPYADDANSNNSYTIEYKLSAAGDDDWTDLVRDAAHADSPYTATISGLAAATSYDVRVTYSDPDGVSGDNPQVRTVTTGMPSVSTLQAWSNLYHGTSTSQQNLSYPVPAGSGQNRLLLVAIASETTAAATRSVSISYGGRSLTLANGDMSASRYPHTALYYLNEAGLDAASSTTLAVTVSGGTTRMTDIFAAVYDGVAQSAPISSSQNYNNSSTVTTFAYSTALSVPARGQAVEIVASDRTGSTTARTVSGYPPSWSLLVQQTSTNTDAIRNMVIGRAVPPAATTDTASITMSDTSYPSMTAVSLAPAKGTPAVIVWPSASTLTSGQTLAFSSLTGGQATVAGTFTFDSPSTVPPAGTYTAPVTFTPDDTASFNTVSGTVEVQVSKLLANVSLSNLTRTWNGSPLAPTVTTTPPGLNVTLTYDGSATAPTEIGSYTVVATISDSNYQGSATDTFTIEADTVAPTVSSTDPANNATVVAVNTPVTITWSENIDCATVTTANITISSGSTGWTKASCDGNTAVFTPSGQDYNRTYTVTIGTGVRDPSANPLASAYTFSYTTVAAGAGAVSILQARPDTPQINNVTSSSATATFTPANGSSRLMLVAVHNAPSNTTATNVSASYGGKELTEIGNSGYNQYRQTWLFYLKEADLAAATNTTLSISNDNGRGGWNAYISTYANVDQNVPVSASKSDYNSQTSSSNSFTLAAQNGGYVIYADTSNLSSDPTASPSGFTVYQTDAVGSSYAYAADKQTTGEVSATFTYNSPVRVGWIAAALSPGVAETSKPTVTAFTASANLAAHEVTIGDFTAADNVGVTGYLVTTSSSAPSASDPRWSDTQPSAVAVGEDNSYTVYPWVRDAAGNVSSLYGSPVIITFRQNQAALEITGPSTATYGAADATISTSGGSGTGAVTFDDGNSTACSIVNNKLHVTAGTGTCSITATKAADDNFTSATSAAYSVTVGKASSSISVTGLISYVFETLLGQGPATASVTGSTGAVTYSYAGTGSTSYGPSATKPMDAGTYSVTATVAADSNFEGATSSAYGFTISAAAQTLSVTNSATYDGTGKAAEVSCSGGGTASSILTGGSATQTNAGDYTVIADCPANGNYAETKGQTAANKFTIAKATPTASLTNTPVTYSGSAQTAAVACLGGGAASLASGGTGTNAGSYAATVDCAESSNYAAATGLSAGNFVIAKATPTASVTNTPVTYNGSAQTAAVACLGGGAATLASGGTGTNAGSYAATVDCAESSNYAAASGLSAGNFVINKASQTVAVNNSPVTYDGTAKAATVTCTGGGASSDIKTGAAASQSAAGTYAVTADCAATDNYSALNDGAAGDFTIAKATPTASLTNTPVSYSGSAQSATAACLGGGAASLASGGTGTNAGSYAATVDCAASDNYAAASGLTPTNGSFVITKANPSVTAWPTAAALSYGDTLVKSTLTGGTITPVGAAGLFAWTVPTTQPPSGTTTQSVTFTATDTTNYNTVRNNVSVTVGKGAQAVLTITAPDSMTYGDADADVSVSGGSGSGATSYVVTGSTACSLVSGKLHVTSGTGTCTITATRAADNNYSPQSGSKVVAISKAAQATLAITAPASATFGAADAAITTTGGTGGGTVTFSAGSSTGCSIVGGKLHVTAGDGTCALTATQAADSNYAATTSAAYTVTPGKAESTITVTGSDSYTYNGSPQGPATVSRTGSTGAVSYSYIGTGSTSYDSATAPTNAGSYSVTASVDADGNYAAKTSAAVDFTIAKKAASVTPSNASKVYQVTPVADPTLTGTLNGFIDGDSITATYSRTGNDAAGTYTISAVLSPENKLANYNITYNTADFVIAGAVQTVTFDDPGAKTYGDEPFALSAAASSNLPVTFSSLTAEVCTVSGSTATIVKAGTCSIRATQAGDGDNLAAASADRSFTVAKADATVALDGLTVKYTAGAQTPTVTTTPAGKAVTVTYNGSTTAPSAVGSYTVVATIADDNYTGSATGTFTIDPADPVGVTISKAAALTDLTNSATLNFDVAFTAAVTGVKGSDFTVTAAGSPSVAVTARSATDYTVAVTGMSDGDISISLAADQVSGLLNNKNLASNAVTVTYDGTPPTLAWTIASSNGMGTAGSYSGASWAVGGQRDGETGFVAGTAVFQRANGGLNLKTNSFTCDTKWNDVAVKGSGASVDLAAGNCYRWTFDPTASSLAVKPADAAGNSAAGLTSPLLKVDQADSTTTVAAASGFTTSSAYGGAAKYAATVSAGSDNLANKEITFYADATTLIGSCTINGANGGCTMTDAYTGLSVGSHKITAVFAGSDNYRSSTSAAATHTVAKATATCTVSGWTGTYDAKAHGASGSCTGVGGATLTGLSLGSSFVNVPGGSTAWNFSNPNYQLPESQDTEAERTVAVTISKASVAVYPTEGLSKVSAVTPLADPPLTYTTDPAGVTLTGALARAAGESVGSYFINSGTLASDNYTVTLLPDFYSFTIKESTSATPDAVADSYKVDRGQVLSIAAPGVMSNDSDPDNTALTAELVTAPTKALTGGFTFNADGSYSYAHDPAKTGNDSFTYKVHNGGNYSAVVTVTLTVFTASQADQEISIAPDRVLVGAENPDAEGCGPPVTFTVANAGAAALNISGVALEDTDTSVYHISANDCAGTLAAAGSCQVEVKYCPGTSTAPKPGRLVVRSSDPETPALAAFLSNYEDAATTASRSLPPVMESLAMPEQITAGVLQTWTWSTLGYSDNYQMFVSFYDCSAITGVCTQLAATSWVNPTSIENGSYDFTGLQSKRCNYVRGITLPVAWKGKNVVIRFFQRSQADAQTGLSGVSQIIPGGLVPVSEYYDTSGRRLVRTVQ